MLNINKSKKLYFDCIATKINAKETKYFEMYNNF